MSDTLSDPSSFDASFDSPPYSDQSVSFGDFVFDGWEVPEKISWGGQQRMTVHKFVGGTRFIDVMGDDNQDVSWSGRFLSPDAAARADQLDQIRKAGSALELIFAGRFYIAVISNFVADQAMQYHVPYNISFTILSDNSAVPAPDVYPLAAVTYDVNACVAIPVAAALLPVQVAMAAVAPILQPMSVIAAGAASTVALAAAVNTASTLVTVAQRTADTQIAALAAAEITAANLAGASTVVAAVSSMQAALAATHAAASAVALAGYIGRASSNIANA